MKAKKRRKYLVVPSPVLLPRFLMASSSIHIATPVFWQGSLESKRFDVLKHLARAERLVSVCPASRLEVRPQPEMLSSGIAALDSMTGGIPRGCMTEIF